MAMKQYFDGLFDELEKIAVAKKQSPFLQTRQGRRSVRVETALRRDDEANKESPDSGAESMEREGGQGMDKDASLKTRFENEDDRKKAMRGFVTARPYVRSAVTGAIPGAIIGGYGMGTDRVSPRGGRIGILIGAGLGATNQYLKNWSKDNPRSGVAKIMKKSEDVPMRSAPKLMKKPEAFKKKTAGMAADLRMTGIGGVKRPPFATEDSKRMPGRLLTQSKKPGSYTMGMTQQKHMSKPGLSIGSVATLPTG